MTKEEIAKYVTKTGLINSDGEVVEPYASMSLEEAADKGIITKVAVAPGEEGESESDDTTTGGEGTGDDTTGGEGTGDDTTGGEGTGDDTTGGEGTGDDTTGGEGTGDDDTTEDTRIHVTTATELDTALRNTGGEVVLDADITYKSAACIAALKDSVLDLNGHTITITSRISKSNYAFIKVYANLTVKGEGSIIDRKSTAITSSNVLFQVIKGTVDGTETTGKLTIEGGSYVSGNYSVVQVDEGAAYINGGEYDLHEILIEGDAEKYGYEYILNKLDSATNATIEVRGGKFHNFNPANNKADGEGTNYLAEGYTVTQDGEYFTVSA